LDEIGTRTREKDTTENPNQRQPVLPRCQTGADGGRQANEFTHFTAQTETCDLEHNFMFIKKFHYFT